MIKRKLVIKPGSEFLEVVKQSLDKEIKGTPKDHMLSMTTRIESDSIVALVVSVDKDSIDNFVSYLVKDYEAEEIEV